MWQYKQSNIHIVGVPKEKEKGAENLFEEIMAEKFPNQGKETYLDPGSQESYK